MRMSRTVGLAIFLALAALPLALGVAYALLYSLGLTGLLNEGFTLVHWRAVLSAGFFWKSLGFSAYVALTTMVISVALGLLAVVRGEQHFRKGWLSTFIYLPLTLPAMVVGFIVFQWLSKAGLFSRLAYQWGWTSSLEAFPDWVNDPYGVGIICSHVFMATPFFIIFFTQLYQSEQLAAHQQLAATLGASSRQLLWRITTPMLLRRAFPTLVLYFIFVLSSYEIPLLLGNQSTQMVSVLTIRKLQRFDLLEIPQAYTISVLYTILVIAMVLFLLRNRNSKLA